MWTVLCNIYIDTEEKYILFKKNFTDLYLISNNWLVYIRGSYQIELYSFIRKMDENKNVKLFYGLNNNSWGTSTKEIIKYSKYEYLFIFIEDHFLQVDIKKLNLIFNEAITNNIDILPYSFFKCDIDYNTLEVIPNLLSENLIIFHFVKDYKNNKLFTNFFPVSLLSFIKKSLFNKLLNNETDLIQIQIPSFFIILIEKLGIKSTTYRKILFKINILIKSLKFRFVIFTPSSPFNIEKSVFEIQNSIKIGIVNEELFASFDDDNGRACSSLIKRGLYPSDGLISINEPLTDYDITKFKEFNLLKGSIVNQQYYEFNARQTCLYKRIIFIVNGNVTIYNEKINITLNSNQNVILYANHNIKLIANEDSKIFKIVLKERNMPVSIYY